MNDDEFDDFPQDPIWANAPTLHFEYSPRSRISLADLQNLFRPLETTDDAN